MSGRENYTFSYTNFVLLCFLSCGSLILWCIGGGSYSYLVRFIELHWGKIHVGNCPSETGFGSTLWKEWWWGHWKVFWFVLQGFWEVPPFPISPSIFQKNSWFSIASWAFSPVRPAYSQKSKQARKSDPPFLMERPHGFLQQHGFPYLLDLQQ